MNKEIFNELLNGLDLDEMKELKGFNRYSVDIRNARVYDRVTESYKKNTPNIRGYTYHTLVNDDDTHVTVSLHHCVMAAALECSIGWWKMFNLVVDHRSVELKGKTGYDAFTNLQLITQSENLKKRQAFQRRGRFSSEELEQLHKSFEELDVKHGELMDAYERIAEEFNSSLHTIQMKYLQYKRKQTA